MKSIRKFTRSKTFTLLLLFIFMVVLFTAVSAGRYLTAKNMKAILNGMVLVAFLAIGEAFLLILGYLDLSVGYLGTLAAFVCCMTLANWNIPWWLALILALCTGGLGGFLNSMMVTKLKFQAFIATLAMSSICQGLTYIINGGRACPLKSKEIIFLGSGTIGGFLPFGIVVALVFLIVYGVILAKTKFGRSIYLCGGNAQAARLAGLHPQKYVVAMFINCGCLASISGLMYAARQKSIMVGGIANNQFTGITAAILGGISFGGGSGNMFGCFLGLCILNGFDVGMTVLGVASYVKTIFSGLLLIAALLFDNFTSARAKRAQLAATKAGKAAGA